MPFGFQISSLLAARRESSDEQTRLVVGFRVDIEDSASYGCAVSGNRIVESQWSTANGKVERVPNLESSLSHKRRPKEHLRIEEGAGIE
jgi:hypothetical protein